MFSPAELEFLAEEAIVTIVPSIRMDKLQLIRDEYGPFRPQVRTEVPLWLALSLRQGGHCRIVPPEWILPQNLQEVLEAERQRPDEFAPGLHPQYQEITHLLCDQSGPAEDLAPHLPDILRLVQSIREIRQQKMISGLQSLDGVPLFLKNVGTLEVNQAKALLVPTMDQLVRFNKLVREEERALSASRSKLSGFTQQPVKSQSSYPSQQ